MPPLVYPAGTATLRVVRPSMVRLVAPLLAMVPVTWLPFTQAFLPLRMLAALAASVVLYVVSTYSAGMAATLTLESTLPLVGVTVWALLVGVTLLLSLVMLTLPLPLW